MMRNLSPEEQLRGGNKPWERKFEGEIPDRTNRNSVYVRSEINGALEIDDKLNGFFSFVSDFSGFFRVFYMVNIWLVICLFLG